MPWRNARNASHKEFLTNNILTRLICSRSNGFDPAVHNLGHFGPSVCRHDVNLSAHNICITLILMLIVWMILFFRDSFSILHQTIAASALLASLIEPVHKVSNAYIYELTRHPLMFLHILTYHIEMVDYWSTYIFLHKTEIWLKTSHKFTKGNFLYIAFWIVSMLYYFYMNEVFSKLSDHWLVMNLW